jgi:hypothetical protein
MKIKYHTILLLAFLCIYPLKGYSQNKKLELGVNLETSHVIEGQIISDMPTLEGFVRYNITPSFALTCEGRAAIAEKKGSHYKEVLWSFAYAKPRIYLGLYSVYNYALDPEGNYFDFSKKGTNHFIEIVTLGKPFKNSLFTVNYNVYVLGKFDLRIDEEKKSHQQYASYLEFSYPFSVEGIGINTFFGSSFALNGAEGHYTALTPGHSGSHFNSFRVVNIGATFSKDVKIGNYKIPISVTPNFNPSGEYVHVQVKVKLL